MFNIPQTVFIGLIVALVGYFLQNRASRLRRIEETRDREFEECKKIISNIAHAAESRLTASTSLAFDLRYGKHTDESKRKLDESIVHWMVVFSEVKFKLRYYFDINCARDFEMQLHSSLKKVSDVTLRKYHYRDLSREHQNEFEQCAAYAGIARHELAIFLEELTQKTENFEIGKSRSFNDINHGNFEDISRFYLIRRLLNINS